MSAPSPPDAIEQLERRNAYLNGVGEGVWACGMGLFSMHTIIPLIILGLGGSAFEVGLALTLRQGLLVLMQLPGSYILGGGVGRKKLLILWHILGGVPPFVIVAMLFSTMYNPVDAAAGVGSARLLIWATIGAVAVFGAAIGMIAPSWMEWVLTLFRTKTRGRHTGFSFGIAALGEVAGALLAAAIISGWGMPHRFTLALSLGAFLLVTSMILFDRIQPVITDKPPRLAFRDLVGRFRHSLSDRNFRRYLLFRILSRLGLIPMFFIAPMFLSRRGGSVSPELIAILAMAAPAVKPGVSILLGRLGDKRGHLVGALAGSLSVVAGGLLVVFGSGPVACALAYACFGATIAAEVVSHCNFMIESCPHDNNTAHLTVAGVLVAPFSGLGPVVAGRAIDAWGYTHALLPLLVCGAAGLLWLIVFVRDPRTEAAAELLEGQVEDQVDGDGDNRQVP